MLVSVYHTVTQLRISFFQLESEQDIQSKLRAMSETTLSKLEMELMGKFVAQSFLTENGYLCFRIK